MPTSSPASRASARSTPRRGGVVDGIIGTATPGGPGLEGGGPPQYALRTGGGVSSQRSSATGLCIRGPPRCAEAASQLRVISAEPRPVPATPRSNAATKRGATLWRRVPRSIYLLHT
eukprot:scaffold517_cov392-Prasinococcus_capsulatus_cf.AAC.15